MPSDARLAWQTDRIPRLQNVDADCLHLEALHAADPDRVQEYIRSYAVLLSSEFQGFCRDLHTECADGLVDSVNPVALRRVLRAQCVYGRKLDTGNPNAGNLGADFSRYLFDFWPAVLAIDPGHAVRQHRLAMLNAWRNAIAHHDYDPAELGGTTTLTIPQVRDWRTDCDAFATAFDAVLRNHLQATTGVSPWPP
ncbi:MAG TPA: HEPN domain-containing protein [Gemmataceae bacterium]|jgi:hypothetical protein|nr:HEPN domain-containing protein [Gemmataceae bacterium]